MTNYIKRHNHPDAILVILSKSWEVRSSRSWRNWCITGDALFYCCGNLSRIPQTVKANYNSLCWYGVLPQYIYCACCSFLATSTLLRANPSQLLIWLMPMNIYRGYCAVLVCGWAHHLPDAYSCLKALFHCPHIEKRSVLVGGFTTTSFRSYFPHISFMKRASPARSCTLINEKLQAASSAGTQAGAYLPHLVLSPIGVLNSWFIHSITESVQFTHFVAIFNYLFLHPKTI